MSLKPSISYIPSGRSGKEGVWEGGREERREGRREGGKGGGSVDWNGAVDIVTREKERERKREKEREC